MKHYNSIVYVVLFVTSLLTTTSLNAQLNLPIGSQKASVSQTVGITNVSINYSRPSVNGREIWGALVPYGMNNLGFGTAKESPWRAGANENTTIKFTSDVNVEGKPLSAGKYGLHIAVKEDGGATVIFSKNHTAWGSFFYNPNEDALRVEVKTQTIPHVEQLTYNFIDVTPNSATAVLNWEKKQIPFKIEVDVTNVVLADIRKIIPDSFLLVPGVGAQGGNLQEVCKYGMNDNVGLLINSSRGIIYASNGNDFAQAASKAAKDLQEQMAACL
mgnify:CR=1 FL=1